LWGVTLARRAGLAGQQRVLVAFPVLAPSLARGYAGPAIMASAHTQTDADHRSRPDWTDVVLRLLSLRCAALPRPLQQPSLTAPT